MLKSNEKCLRCKQINNYFRKSITTDKKYILRISNLKTLNRTSHAKKSFMYFLFIICNSLDLGDQ